jgi:hypothetical protein
MSAVKATCGDTPFTEPAELRRELRLDAFHPDYRRRVGEVNGS